MLQGSLTFNVAFATMSSDDLPTMRSNVPGTTTQRISWFSSCKSSGPSVNFTVFFSPGSSAIRSKPRSCLMGVATGVKRS